MIKKRYVLNFPPESGDKPLSYHLVRDYDIRINILKAEVYPGKRGSLLLELQGKKENIEKGVQYLTDHQVICEPLDKRIHFQEENVFCRCADDEPRNLETGIRQKQMCGLRALHSRLPVAFVRR